MDEGVEQYYVYLREKETRDPIPVDFMARHPDINERMRYILIDWLAEVHLKFKLLPETYFLTCLIVDHYLAKQIVSRSSLQLVGVSSMLIASKYEENNYPLEVADLVYSTDHAYTRDDILDMEEKILKTIEYNLSYPSVYHFYSCFSKAIPDNKTRMLCTYLIEISTLDVTLYKYLPSQIAAASIYLAYKMMGKESLQKYLTYTEQDVKDCAIELNNLRIKVLASIYRQYIVRKYSQDKFGCVAQINMMDEVR